MDTTLASRPAARDITAAIPYVGADVERIDVRFDEPGAAIPVAAHEMPVRDGRRAVPPPSLDREGLTIAHHPSTVVRHRRDELIAANAAPSDEPQPVNLAYMDEHLDLIARLSGAREVFAQLDTITVRFSERAATKSWMGTAAFAHFDFEASSADRLLADTLRLTGRTVAPFSRQVLYQTWRVITPPPQDRPLALCDGRTVQAGDIVPMVFHGPPGSRNELMRSRAGRHSPAHRWFYFPDMTPDEVLVFKGFDSAAPAGRTAMHTAFDDPSRTDPVPRGSVECRFIALYD